eukprot:XP_001693410.1 ubiquitin-like protein [Chlamydomonas reinhardtii]
MVAVWCVALLCAAAVAGGVMLARAWLQTSVAQWRSTHVGEEATGRVVATAPYGGLADAPLPLRRSVQVFVRTLRGRTVAVTALPEDPVEVLLHSPATSEGAPPVLMQLLWCGRALHLDRSLAWHGISHGSTVLATSRLLGGVGFTEAHVQRVGEAAEHLGAGDARALTCMEAGRWEDVVGQLARRSGVPAEVVRAVLDERRRTITDRLAVARVTQRMFAARRAKQQQAIEHAAAAAAPPHMAGDTVASAQAGPAAAAGAGGAGPSAAVPAGAARRPAASAGRAAAGAAHGAAPTALLGRHGLSQRAKMDLLAAEAAARHLCGRSAEDSGVGHAASGLCDLTARARCGSGGAGGGGGSLASSGGRGPDQHQVDPRPTSHAKPELAPAPQPTPQPTPPSTSATQPTPAPEPAVTPANGSGGARAPGHNTADVIAAVADILRSEPDLVRTLWGMQLHLVGYGGVCDLAEAVQQRLPPRLRSKSVAALKTWLRHHMSEITMALEGTLDTTTAPTATDDDARLRRPVGGERGGGSAARAAAAGCR